MKKTIPIFLAFFVMGFGDAVGTLVGFVTREYDLTPSLAGLLPFFGLLAFGLFSVPIGVLSARKGKKFVLVVFLCITLIGLIIPVISIAQYYYVLIAIFLLGLGMAGLQVAGNPAMREVSAEGNYSRNLTFAQFIKSLGTISAPYMTPFIVVVLGLAWYNIFAAFALVVLICLAIIIPINIPHREEQEQSSIANSFSLLKKPYVLFMVLGIFFYVGAEVGMNSWIATFLNIRFGLEIESMATLGIGFFLTALVIGRLIGAAVLHYVSPVKFFIATSALGLVGMAGMFVPIQSVVIVSLFLCGLGFGNIFPLIFSILIDSMPERSSELSGLLVMAIVGGAVIPAIMGVIADWSIQLSFLLPLAIFVYLLVLAIYTFVSVSSRIAPEKTS